MSIPGIENGVLVDPKRWWLEHVTVGKDPADFASVLAEIEHELTRFGIGIMRDAQVYQDNPKRGTPRGRVYLPTAACRFPAPEPGDSADTVFYGVKRDAACWSLEIQIISGDSPQTHLPTRWDWFPMRGTMNDYRPVASVPPDPPAPSSELADRVASLETTVRTLQQELSDFKNIAIKQGSSIHIQSNGDEGRGVSPMWLCVDLDKGDEGVVFANRENPGSWERFTIYVA